MSFELALIIVLALTAIALGLTCYHLLGRLEILERAVQGGLQPPTTRLRREQFEQRFRTAHARSALAEETGTAVLLAVGPEYPTSTLARTVDQLPRQDLLTIRDANEFDTEVGITTTPYVFVIDDGQLRTARPVASIDDLLVVLKDAT